MPRPVGGGKRGETGTEIVGWALEALFSLALVVNWLSHTSRTSQVQVAVIQTCLDRRTESKSRDPVFACVSESLRPRPASVWKTLVCASEAIWKTLRPPWHSNQ